MYHYKECGLPNVRLKNGFTTTNHEEYGECVSIHDMDGLHLAIGLNITNNSLPVMTGAEFRFLRIELDLSQRSLGGLIGVTEQTIANYEKNKPSVMGDRFLRVFYKGVKCNDSHIRENLERLNSLDRDMAELEKQIELEERESGWAIAA